MPVISRFFGLVVAMYYNDHDLPHFHVRYGDHQALVAISDLRILAGGLPPRALGLVVEWACCTGRASWRTGSGPEGVSP
ncbi:DUF4160 domain-containing protein [Thermus islandicus]|uniref:DUF4160 domain-containing protein n=1 Tax=Thermus islandicus TaxID=540988 RepID=UPI00041F3431|nr:DUF4160 domain-containing protein [Thermus islandicus]